jgi:hypothetical protein
MSKDQNMVVDLVQQQTMTHLACEMSWVRNLFEEMDFSNKGSS